MFSDILDGDNDINVVEIVLVTKKDAMCEYNLDQDRFLNLLKFVSKKYKLKYFSKKTKRYRIDNQFMEIHNDDIKVYQQSCVSSTYDDQFLCSYYKRDKLPYHKFPCTRNINEIVFIQRLTYRLHNRLFLNFEIQKNMQNEQTFKVYFNYNHTKSSELNTIRSMLQEFVTMIRSF
jgi:hypothetical protein